MRTRLPRINYNRDVKSFQTPAYSGDIPDQFDWRPHFVVGPVVNQGELGYSQLHATIGSIEGSRSILNSIPLVLLSTQQIVDCFSFNASVTSIDIYQDIINQGGIETAGNYPSGNPGSCKFNESSPDLTQLMGYRIPPAGDEANLKAELYLVGPLAVLIDANSPSFGFYSGGIYTNANCMADSPNQGLLLVGYGTDNQTGQDYWTLRNSWGETWGENGYIRVERGVNICGVSNYASSALLVPY